MLTFIAMLTFTTVAAELVLLKTASPAAVIKTEQTIAQIGGYPPVGVPSRRPAPSRKLLASAARLHDL